LSAAARGRAGLAALGIVALMLPFLLSRHWLSTAVFVLIAALGALGLNVLSGYAGQVSLGHSFFLGVGAYTAGVLGGDHKLSAAIWLPAAGVTAALAGALVGPTALRLRGLYLAIVTIGLVFIGQHLFLNIPALSGGPAGRSLPAPTFGPLDFSQELDLGGVAISRDGLYYYLALLLLVLSMTYVFNLSRTRLGRAFKAIREREVASAVIGIDLARTKVAAFVISSFLAGLAGALYGSYLSFVVPAQWGLLLSVEYVAIIIVGGVGTVWGSLLGSIFVAAVPAVLQSLSGSVFFLQHSAGGGGVSLNDAAAILYGLLIIAFLILEPRGLAGILHRVAQVRHRYRAAEPIAPSHSGSAARP
jgi:branched-chain amino acid transport system permease protein